MEGPNRGLSIISAVSAMFRKSNLLIDSPCGAVSCSQGQRGDNDSLRQCTVSVRVSRFPSHPLALSL